MKKINLTWLLLCLWFPMLESQSFPEGILSEIEQNNSYLAALREQSLAERIGYDTGLNPEDPELGFNYLFSSPGDLGNRTDLSLVQNFDFPTVYKHRKELSSLKKQQLELNYQRERQAIFLKAGSLMVSLGHGRKMMTLLMGRIRHAREIEAAFQLRFEQGESSIFDLNKAKINLLNLESQLEQVQINQSSAMRELSRLNGGKIPELPDLMIFSRALPEDFESWFAEEAHRIPLISWQQGKIELLRKEASLTRAENWPGFSAGYMSESITGEVFRGLSLGMHLPLWENRRKREYAEARIKAAESSLTDHQLQIRLELRNLFSTARELENSRKLYQEQLSALDHRDLLYKALETGEMSLIDYLRELAVFYEGEDRLAEMEYERDLASMEMKLFLK